MSAKRKTKLNLKPAAGYLLIESVTYEPEKKTASGIYLPETSEEHSQKGRVLAIGPDKITELGAQKPSPAKVGDIIVHKKYKEKEQNKINIDGKKCLLAKFEDILAVVK